MWNGCLGNGLPEDRWVVSAAGRLPGPYVVRTFSRVPTFSGPHDETWESAVCRRTQSKKRLKCQLIINTKIQSCRWYLTTFSNFGQHEVRHQLYNSAVERCQDRTAQDSSKGGKVLYKIQCFIDTVNDAIAPQKLTVRNCWTASRQSD
jgi:hypothetical protein